MFVDSVTVLTPDTWGKSSAAKPHPEKRNGKQYDLSDYGVSFLFAQQN